MKLSYVELAAALDEVSALVRDCKFVPVQKLQHIWDARDYFAALAQQAQPKTERDYHAPHDASSSVPLDPYTQGIVDRGDVSEIADQLRWWFSTGILWADACKTAYAERDRMAQQAQPYEYKRGVCGHRMLEDGLCSFACKPEQAQPEMPTREQIDCVAETIEEAIQNNDPLERSRISQVQLRAAATAVLKCTCPFASDASSCPIHTTQATRIDGYAAL